MAVRCGAADREPCITVGINALGAHFGGIVRVLEQVTRVISQRHSTRVWFAPRQASLPDLVAIESVQGPSRRSTFLAALARILAPATRVDVRVDIAQGFLLRVRARKRVLVVHDLGYRDPRNVHVNQAQQVYRDIITRWGIRQSDIIVAVSERTREELRSLAPGAVCKVRVLPLPVDNMIDVLNDLAHPSVNRVAPDGTRILAFGHALNKGVESLVDLAVLRPDVTIRVVSPESFWRNSGYAQLVTSKGLGGRIARIGDLTDADLVREYLSADVFCMPSSYEGYGLPVAEALACGRPTVISDLDVLESTARGFAVRCEGWGAEALSAACDVALAKPAEHWQQAAREFRAWTWERWVEAMLAGVCHNGNRA